MYMINFKGYSWKVTANKVLQCMQWKVHTISYREKFHTTGLGFELGPQLWKADALSFILVDEKNNGARYDDQHYYTDDDADYNFSANGSAIFRYSHRNWNEQQL